MSSYRTEIVVPPDRYVYLQLPPDFPLGNAEVVVRHGVSSELAVSTEGDSSTSPAAGEAEGDDIEWWEEFDGDLA
ncbi:MAG: hypothetical protein U0794_13230 [Isosphaeraceae bacterium]